MYCVSRRLVMQMLQMLQMQVQMDSLWAGGRIAGNMITWNMKLQGWSD